MSTHQHIDRVCAAAAVLSLLLAILFVNGEALGLTPASRVMGYETRLFDPSRVHTIEIIMDDWDSFLETCENEEYSPCSVLIDSEGFKNVGLRAKGNTSLSTVSSLGSDRYSFKLEFDQYDSGKTYHGLDKLCLNNLIQDNTMMKDYLVYRMMAQFGAAAPLCSFVYITVNGEDWGLYLAVEGVEESFLQRNYGSRYGNLYKPDSMSFGGGRGNGRGFNMEEFDFPEFEPSVSPGGQEGLFPGGGTPGRFGRKDQGPGDMPQDGSFQPPDAPGGEGRGNGGMGADDVKLKYLDDDPDSYSNIFSSAKTDLSQADQERLIQALKVLSEGGDVSSAVDIDAVLRYFAVHNFVVNGDSYTGSMVHNYYLYEEDGLLSMLPWDYNLAFGTFQGSSASSAVNDPIDSPLSVTGSGDRPMADWIFSSQAYTQLYHQYLSDFLNTVDCAALIDQAYALIAPYVEQDPTRFCTYEEFETGVSALKTFCQLRTESISGQLDGTIPSTTQGQSDDPSALVDASGLSLSDMGTMNQGGGFPGGFSRPEDGVDMPVFGTVPSGSMEPSGGDAGDLRPEHTQRPGVSPGENIPGLPEEDGTQPPAPDTTGPALLAAAVLVLLLGMLAAFKFQRFGRQTV